MLFVGVSRALLVAHMAIATSVAAGSFGSLSTLIRRAPVDPTPISVSPSQNWDGPDGPWSSFTLRVGTPAQDVRVFISTASQGTWVVIPAGCPGNSRQNCEDLRGNVYNYNQSSTWSRKGYYNLGNEDNLDLTNGGLWGNETIGLGVQGSGGPTLDHQVVAGIQTLDFYLGMFGVNPKPTNFTGLSGDSQDSYMTTLKKQNLIPSVTFGYSAGAPYRLKKVLGTLTLGGYDASRFTPNPLSFSFAPDNDRDIVVGIQAIKSTTEAGKTANLLPGGGITSYIDSTVPYIWLPADACKAFEDAFGLEWNSDKNLYPVSDELHTQLVKDNATITFTLGNNPQGGETIDITLPYNSFDLQLTWPVVTNSTKYFPLKRADNETQYTLGRTFLQEAYLIVDYERSNFSVSQAKFEDSSQQQLTPIKALNATLTKTSTGNSGTSKGTTAGIAIGVVLFVLICVSAVVAFFIIKRKRDRRRKEADEAKTTTSSEEDPAEKVRQGFAKAELGTDSENVRHEVAGDEAFQERAEIETPPTAGWVADKARHPGSKTDVAEMNGGDVSRAELSESGKPPAHEMYDPSIPAVELPAETPQELQGSVPSPSRSPKFASSGGWTRPRSGNGSSAEPSPLRESTQLSPTDRQQRRIPRSRYSSVRTGEGSPSTPSAPSQVGAPSPNRSTLTTNNLFSPISPLAESEQGGGGRTPRETDGLFSRLRGFAHHRSGSSSNQQPSGRSSSGSQAPIVGSRNSNRRNGTK